MRRSSLGSNNIGEPYQIYSEVTNAGKNLQGSKCKVRWLIGFSEASAEHEIVFIQSFMSGKKSIYEDGQLIVEATNMMSTEFGHSWKSNSTGRLYRVESSTGVTTEHSYNFSVDGVKFNDMPRQPVPQSRGSITATSEPERDATARRSSAGGFGSEERRSSATRGTFQSPVNAAVQSRGSSSFDPFQPSSADSGNFSSDPFATQERVPTKKSPAAVSFSSDPFATQESVPPKKSPAAVVPSTKPVQTPSFDAFENSTAPGSGGGFDAFDSSTPTTSSGAGGFDPFTSTPDSATSNFDSSDPFGDNNKPTPPKLQQPKIAAPRRGSAAPDLLDEPIPSPAVLGPTGSEADFESSRPAPPVSAPGGAVRRNTAAEIQMDFAGLSFETHTPPRPEVISAQNPSDGQSEVAEGGKLQKPQNVDPWQAGDLVDLDLTGRSAAAAARRKSSTASDGPSLNSLMNGDNAKRRESDKAAMEASRNDPFGAPPMLMQQPAAAQSMAGMGAQQQPMTMGGPMGYGYGGGMGGPPPPSMGMNMGGPPPGGMGPPMPVMGSAMQQQPMYAPNSHAAAISSIGPPMAPGMNHPPRGYPMGGYGAYPPPQQQQQKNSLDALQWK